MGTQSVNQHDPMLIGCLMVRAQCGLECLLEMVDLRHYELVTWFKLKSSCGHEILLIDLVFSLLNSAYSFLCLEDILA